MKLVHVRLESGVVQQPLEGLSELTEVSLDGGVSWTTAAAARKRLQQPVDDGVALFIPVGVEPRSMLAGYAALASFFLFGGPLVFVATLFAWDTGPKFAVRLGAVLIGFVLGPLPIAGLGWWALRVHRADASQRGRGRAVFALVVAAVLTLPLLAGLGMLVARSGP